jgi:hypothetical protein
MKDALELMPAPGGLTAASGATQDAALLRD